MDFFNNLSGDAYEKPDDILVRAQSLFDQGLYKSSEFMSSTLLSQMSLNHQSSHDIDHIRIHAKACVLYADCLFQLKEYRRATPSYTKALQLFRFAKLSQIEEISVRQKLARAALQAKDLATARVVLEAIPDEKQTPKSLLMLANINEESSDFQAAIECYRNIARLEPDALEAHQALVRLGVAPDRVISLVNQGCPEKLLKASTMDNKSPTQSDWILHYISALYLQTSHQYSKGFDQFSRLESIFKGNITLLLHMAECSFKAGNVLNAFYLYSQIRKLDVNSIDAMDRYAGLIKNQGKHIQLNKLANELLRVNDERPETWVALARYCESKEDLDRALHFVEKALSLNQRHVEAHLLKGSLLLSTNKPQEALSSYRNASKHTQDIFIYQGLMECYVALGKFKEALVVAKEALNIMPNNARALTLVGIVLLKFEGKTEKAKLVFQKALQADPKCSEAIVALVDVFCGEKKFDLAVKVLQHHLALHHTDFMHTKLGEVYFSKKEYALALGSFNTALAINADYGPAQDGFNRVDRFMNGEGEEGDESAMDL